MPAVDDDVIDTLARIRPGSALDAIRGGREQARSQAQASYRALFEPELAGDVTPQERFAVASFVAGVHAQQAVAAFYRSRLAAAGASAPLQTALDTMIGEATARGPYGNYPPGPLSGEDAPGPTYRVPEAHRATCGPRLTAALEQSHMLVFHPRDAAPQPLQALLDAGWSTTGIVTLSQLVAFLSYQIRAIAGLRALASLTREAPV